jgi:predicted small secreted protein
VRTVDRVSERSILDSANFTVNPLFRLFLVRSEGNSSMRMSSIVLLASLLACAVAVSGCANTVRGVGQDVKSTVKAVEQETE